MDKVVISRIGRCAVWFVLLGCGLMLLRPQPYIEIRVQDTVCLWPRRKIVLHWRHSVEKQDWQEVWQLEGRLLRLQAVYVQTFGAGVPTDGRPVAAPAGYVGLQAAAEVPQIEWVVSSNMRGRLLADGISWPVYRQWPEYTPVTIAVSTHPLIKQLLKRDCL